MLSLDELLIILVAATLADVSSVVEMDSWLVSVVFSVWLQCCSTYNDVKEHFREDHYLCEEDECARIQFTNAFRSEMDIKAHKAQYHLKGAKR